MHEKSPVPPLQELAKTVLSKMESGERCPASTRQVLLDVMASPAAPKPPCPIRRRECVKCDECEKANVTIGPKSFAVV